MGSRDVSNVLACVHVCMGVYTGIFRVVGLVRSDSVFDPNQQHDAKECGTYLCPSHTTAAETYIEGGCEGDFSLVAKQTMLEEARWVLRCSMTQCDAARRGVVLYGVVRGRALTA